MKKFTTIILMLLISFCFILTGCGETPLVMPQNYQTPVSNGGFVVGAGNYMYFANAYKASSSLNKKSDNSGKGVKQHSLKRLELDTTYSNRTWFNIVKNENDEYSYENVANKIAGYEASNMYVVNNYLYFTSPNVHKNKENDYEFELQSLFRINLNGTGLKEIYTSKKENAKFYLTGGQNKQILIFDNNEIKAVNVGKNSTSVYQIAKEVSDVVFPTVQEQEIAWLYYTANRDEDSQFTGNVLKKVTLKANAEPEVVMATPGETITVISQDFGRLFYKKTGGSVEGLFSNDFGSGSSQKLHRTLLTGIDDGSDLMYIKCEANSDCDAFVFIYNDNLYIQLMSASNESQATKITTDSTTIQFSSGSYVYYSTDSGIFRYSVLDKQEQQITDKKDINTKSMDFDGRYVYFFAKGNEQETSTEYLFRANADYSGEMETECIAELVEEDIPQEDEETGEEQ